MVADLKFFELHVLPVNVGRISHEDDGIPIFSSPFGINSMAACIVDDTVQDVVGRDRQNPGADLFEGELDCISTWHPRPCDDGDDRLHTPLLQLEGENDSIGLEQQAGLVHFRRKAVGEVGDEVFGEPGVDLLVREDGLPVGLVADIVAKLNALRHEFLGPACSLLARKTDHGTIIVGLVRQGEPAPRGIEASAPRPTLSQISVFVVLCIGHPDP